MYRPGCVQTCCGNIFIACRPLLKKQDIGMFCIVIMGECAEELKRYFDWINANPGDLIGKCSVSGSCNNQPPAVI